MSDLVVGRVIFSYEQWKAIGPRRSFTVWVCPNPECNAYHAKKPDAWCSKCSRVADWVEVEVPI